MTKIKTSSTQNDDDTEKITKTIREQKKIIMKEIKRCSFLCHISLKIHRTTTEQNGKKNK